MQTDLIIIGAGPVGIFTAFQAGILGMRSCLVDSLPVAGGQCAALYPEKPIYDIPGFKSILAKELIDNLLDQASRFSPQYILGTLAEAISTDGNTVNCWLSNGQQLSAKALVIAGGSGIFTPNKPPLEGLQELEGEMVSYSVTDVKKFKDQVVLIGGGGDSAIDWAITISDLAKRVILVHRRNNFRCAASQLSDIKTRSEIGKIDLVTPFRISGIRKSDKNSVSINVKNIAEPSHNKDLEANFVLLFFGLKNNLGPIKNFGLITSERGVKVNPENLSTNLPRVYAVGDIADYPGKVNLILAGFSEAAMACHSIRRMVEGQQALEFEHSTSNAVFAD